MSHGQANFSGPARVNVLAWSLLLLAVLSDGYAYGAPTVGAIGSSAQGGEIGRYQKLELSCKITTDAANKFLPYDPVAPPYAANLKPDEDARQGVSVDALFLPPGQTDWGRARVQPGFWYQGFVFTPPVEMKHNTDNLALTGPGGWRVRFAPDVVGQWQYRLRVTDAGGTAESPVKRFFCVSSPSRGFVRVCPTDRRYLQYDDGTACNFVGDNFQGGKDLYEAWAASMDAHAAGGAHVLIRHWIGARNGIEVYGGFANSTGGRVWDFANDKPHWDTLRGDIAHSGRYSVQVSPGGSLGATVPVMPHVGYTLSAWVKTEHLAPEPGRAPVCRFACNDDDGYRNGVSQEFSLDGGSGWTRFSLQVSAHDPRGGTPYWLGFKISPVGIADGDILIDDVQVTDDSTGRDVLLTGDFERHVIPNLRQAWLLDDMVDTAARRGQSLRLVCFDNDDAAFCRVDTQGRPATHSSDNFFGGTTDPNADVPVRRWQAYAVRYLQARWGYSTAIAEWEFNNEGALYNGNHYAAAQAFARDVHAYSAHGRRLAGTSFWENSAGPSFAADFYFNPRYPDVDYADVHEAPSAAGGCPNVPFDGVYGGFVRLPNGGPDHLGALHLDGRTTKGQMQHAPFSLQAIQGRGRWTVSYKVRADAQAHLKWFGRGPDLELWCRDLNITALTIPAPAQTPPLPPGYDWRTVSRTFDVPDNARHEASLWAYAVGLSGGSVDFSDVKVIAPDGRLWAYYPFNEPQMLHDTASLAANLGLQHTSWSGDPLIGKPFSIGETNIVQADGQFDPDARRDTQGAFMRQFAWAHMNASGATAFWWSYTGDLATAGGFWKYAGAYQRFMQDIPLTNGRYRNIMAVADSPQLVVIGQKDSQDGRAQFYAYNRSGNWYNSAVNPASVAPVSGMVSVPGLPNGAYRVETWDTSLGTVRSSASLTTSGGTLIVPIMSLVADVAVKIFPVAADGHAVGGPTGRPPRRTDSLPKGRKIGHAGGA